MVGHSPQRWREGGKVMMKIQCPKECLKCQNEFIHYPIPLCIRWSVGWICLAHSLRPASRFKLDCSIISQMLKSSGAAQTSEQQKQISGAINVKRAVVSAVGGWRRKENYRLHLYSAPRFVSVVMKMWPVSREFQQQSDSVNCLWCLNGLQLRIIKNQSPPFAYTPLGML